MAYQANENTQEDHSEDKKLLEWEIINPNEVPVLLGNKYFIILTGNTVDTQKAIMNRLKSHQPDLKEVSRVEECDFILLFCPVVSRVGTDIEAAMQALHNISDTKPAVLMVLHHTFDPGCVLPDSSRVVKRTKMIIVNWRFHEDQGLLQCPKNDDSFGIVINHMPNPSPVQGGWFGIVMESAQFLKCFSTGLWNSVPPLSYLFNTSPAIQDKKETREQLRLVLLGRTGSGKTAAGNTILGIKEGNQATTSTATSPFTQQSVSTQGEVAGRKLTLVDTPDWFSSEFSQENLRQNVGHCVHLSAPGPHAFLLVLPLKRSPGWETGMLEKVEECWGEECWENTMILFTDTDEHEKEYNQTFIQQADQEVKKLVEKCGHRFHRLNIQEREDGTQVSELLDKIEKMVEGSRMKFYSSDIYQGTEREIRRVIEKANEKAAGEEREIKEDPLEANFTKFLLPELWKYILTLKYKPACVCSVVREDEQKII